MTSCIIYHISVRIDNIFLKVQYYYLWNVDYNRLFDPMTKSWSHDIALMTTLLQDLHCGQVSLIALHLHCTQKYITVRSTLKKLTGKIDIMSTLPRLRGLKRIGL